eukprot:1089419-Alexandrium_andersonii.AAC.1
MSASLVGSEMCIRDRAERARGLHGQERPPAPVAAPRGPRAAGHGRGRGLPEGAGRPGLGDAGRLRVDGGAGGRGLARWALQ